MEIKYLTVGEIINTHGVRGEVKVNPLTDNIERFKKLDYVYLGPSKRKYKIESRKSLKTFVVLKLESIDDMDSAERLKKTYIYIDEKDRVKLPKDHYFIYEVIGCKVFDLENKLIGQVKDVITYTSNDVYVVYDELANKEYLIPARKEFVKNIDIDEKIIVIDPIEGMIE